MTRPVLALDLATTTGWAVRTAAGDLLHGHVTLAGGTVARIRSAEDWLPTVLAHVSHGRGDVVRERAITQRFRAAIRSAVHLEGALFSVASAMGVPEEAHHETAPADWKKWLTGNGNATKEDVLAEVRRRWVPDVEDYNEADAIALLHHHLETRGTA